MTKRAPALPKPRCKVRTTVGKSNNTQKKGGPALADPPVRWPGKAYRKSPKARKTGREIPNMSPSPIPAPKITLCWPRSPLRPW